MLIELLDLDTSLLLKLSFALVTAIGYLLVVNQSRFVGLRLFLLTCGSLMSLEILQQLFILTTTPYQVALTLALGPGFYLFVYHLVYSHQSPDRLALVHFLPMLVALVFQPDPVSLGWLGCVSVFGYSVLSLRLVRKYHLASFASRADAETTTIHWVYGIMFGSLALYFAHLLVMSSDVNLGTYAKMFSEIFILAMLNVLFVYLVIKTSANPGLFDGLGDYEHWAESQSIQVDSNYREMGKDLYKVLERKIIAEKSYTNKTLSLADLADETGNSLQDISWAINQGAGISFCDYINEYRVEAVKKALSSKDNGKRDMVQIALSSGFVSKASFFRVFKRFTGQMPKDYVFNSEKD